jgi:hypothetical protein
MAITTQSLRQFLQGSLTDFADSCQMAPLVTSTTLASLVVLLSNLREEGAELIPEVYLCENHKETLKLLPDNDLLPIGETKDPISSITAALKKCSPLAIGGWCIYISPSELGYQFGLFRGSLNPLSISVNRTLFSEELESIKVVRLFRTATGCVELCNNFNNTRCILLNDKPEGEPPPDAYTENLIDLICRDVHESMREPTKTYVGKALSKALAACHGALIVITKHNKVPAFLSDGVILQSPIDLIEAVANKGKYGEELIAEHRLNAYTSLIQGMVSSDGITVFSTKGKLLAYNCFIKSQNKLKGKKVLGGARTRAYESLKIKIGKGIDAVFIQSQDGWTKIAKEE